MNTIQTQLAKVKERTNQLNAVQQNYQMGLITMAEMHNQSLDLILDAKQIIESICKEYEINTTAVNLMLEL
jgi:hypothetical protein